MPSTAAPPNMPTPSPAFLPFSVISDAGQLDLLAHELGDVTRQLLDQLRNGFLTLFTFTTGQVDVTTHGWTPPPRFDMTFPPYTEDSRDISP